MLKRSASKMQDDLKVLDQYLRTNHPTARDKIFKDLGFKLGIGDDLLRWIGEGAWKLIGDKIPIIRVAKGGHSMLTGLFDMGMAASPPPYNPGNPEINPGVYTDWIIKGWEDDTFRYRCPKHSL
jgi:hypothetical protein